MSDHLDLFAFESNTGFTPEDEAWLNEPQQCHERGEHDFEADLECEACLAVIEEGEA